MQDNVKKSHKVGTIQRKTVKNCVNNQKNGLYWTPDKIVEWHKKTFPNETLAGMLLKLEEEVAEVIEAQENQDFENANNEMADVLIVSTVLANRFDSVLGRYFLTLDVDYPTPDLERRINEKMNINATRKWVYKKGVYRHKELLK